MLGWWGCGDACRPEPESTIQRIQVNQQHASRAGGYAPIPMSKAAARTFNPIKQVVEGIDTKPNPQKDLIPLSIGDPTFFGNFQPPESVTEAFQKNLAGAQCNGYTHSCGLEEARAAVANIFSTNPKYPLAYDDVVMTSGCSQALDLAISAVANPGEHNILLPRPCFPLYMTICGSKGISMKHYDLIPSCDWEIDLKHLESLIDKNTRAILINNPSNPCGAVFSRKHLEDLCMVAKKHRLLIIADEIYANMTFPQFEFTPLNDVSDDVPFLEVNGIAKQYMVPGWRVGWVLIRDRNNMLKEIKAGIQSLTALILGPSTIVQSVVPHLLEQTESDYYKDVLHQMSENVEVICNGLNDCRGLKCYRPQGAMCVMVEILDKRFNDKKFTSDLLAEESVFVLPGECFGIENFFRIVVSPPKDKLEEAMSRICGFCAKYFDKVEVDTHVTEHDIPEPYKWNTSFDINNNQLNKQHSKLFDMIDDMCNNPNDLARWVKLVQYVVDHFATEKEMLNGLDGMDPAYQQHHKDFIEFVQGVRLPVDQATSMYLKRWLVDHIKNYDMTYYANIIPKDLTIATKPEK